MAQTRKRRKRKHRGTQAGTVEARGRTGRAPEKSERKGASGRAKSAAERRAERMSKPPTWRGSMNRALVAAVLFAAVVVVAFGQPVASGIFLGLVMVLIYLPMTYYMDLFLYRRFQRRQTARK